MSAANEKEERALRSLADEGRKTAKGRGTTKGGRWPTDDKTRRGRFKNAKRGRNPATGREQNREGTPQKGKNKA